ncbi:MAG: hypothetical protein IJ542_03745 [Clostridia bacterium]|nr:hypothetical protein [Clostridia bacterium]
MGKPVKHGEMYIAESNGELEWACIPTGGYLNKFFLLSDAIPTEYIIPDCFKETKFDLDNILRSNKPHARIYSCDAKSKGYLEGMVVVRNLPIEKHKEVTIVIQTQTSYCFDEIFLEDCVLNDVKLRFVLPPEMKVFHVRNSRTEYPFMSSYLLIADEKIAGKYIYECPSFSHYGMTASSKFEVVEYNEFVAAYNEDRKKPKHKFSSEQLPNVSYEFCNQIEMD